MQVRHSSRGSGGFTLVELMVVVIIIGILAAAAVPIYTAQSRRARTAEAMSGLGAIRHAEQVYHTEKGVYLAVAAGNIANTTLDTSPGLGLDCSLNTYYDDNCYSVTLDATYGFVASCNGGSEDNAAPRANDVEDIIVELRGNGQARTSFDGGTSYTSWE